MSRRAAARLESFGFDNVCVYIGAKQDWLAFGLPFEGSLADERTAGSSALKDVPVCAAEENLAQARSRAEQIGWQECVVLNDDKVVLGLLDKKAWRGHDGAPVEQAMDPAPLTVRPNMTLKSAIEKMRGQKVSGVVVTTPDGKLIGLLRQNETK